MLAAGSIGLMRKKLCFGNRQMQKLIIVMQVKTCGVHSVLNSCGHAFLCGKSNQRYHICSICRISFPQIGNRLLLLEHFHRQNKKVVACALYLSRGVEEPSGRITYTVVLDGLCRVSIQKLSARDLITELDKNVKPMTPPPIWKVLSKNCPQSGQLHNGASLPHDAKDHWIKLFRVFCQESSGRKKFSPIFVNGRVMVWL
ncbi:hypothetical protein Nepgr_004735 [Nepenthes gracilis]|uniref:Uncharacterized protein n=1 Tax=Nepenthes gracilis TaxID=150966 RepID=A0AAD3XFQ3_NEPGR|nr:hypothetical protein Nepgr_004735 [Nepenthes gracilis]